jgi:hypothetical protein
VGTSVHWIERNGAGAQPLCRQPSRRHTGEGAVGENPYEEIADDIHWRTGFDTGFNALLAPEPERLTPGELATLRAQFSTIRRFQARCIELFYDSLGEEGELSKLLFMGVPPGLGAEFHLALPEHLRHAPRFFRTDQPKPGAICEIQTPGSGWGECCMLMRHYQRLGNVPSFAPTLADKLTEQFHRITQGAPPVIHHLTDNASVLADNVYLIQSCRAADAGVRYIGYDGDVRPTDCNLVRTHLFAGMMVENFAQPRLEAAARGELWYDYPPLCIFEQKLLLALPFDPEYADKFDDDIRAVIPFSSIMRPDRCTLPDGRTLALMEIADLPRSERQFFLKFAGIDPARNWGSRGVFHAGEQGTKERVRHLLHIISDDYAARRGAWIIQGQASCKKDCRILQPEGAIVEPEWYRRLSVFYGPAGLMACCATYRDMKKVHGQRDALINLVITDELDG